MISGGPTSPEAVCTGVVSAVVSSTLVRGAIATKHVMISTRAAPAGPAGAVPAAPCARSTPGSGARPVEGETVP